MYICVHSYTVIYLCLYCIQLFATLWTAACQALLSMVFPRQGYRSGLPFPIPWDLPDPGIKSESLVSPALAGGFFATETHGKQGTWRPLLLTWITLCEEPPHAHSLPHKWLPQPLVSTDHENETLVTQSAASLHPSSWTWPMLSGSPSWGPRQSLLLSSASLPSALFFSSFVLSSLGKKPPLASWDVWTFCSEQPTHCKRPFSFLAVAFRIWPLLARSGFNLFLIWPYVFMGFWINPSHFLGRKCNF